MMLTSGVVASTRAARWAGERGCRGDGEGSGLAAGWASVARVDPGGGGELGHSCGPTRERGKFEPELLFSIFQFLFFFLGT